MGGGGGIEAQGKMKVEGNVEMGTEGGTGRMGCMGMDERKYGGTGKGGGGERDGGRVREGGTGEREGQGGR